MPRTKKTTLEKVEITNPEDGADVVAYRVGQVEAAVKEGFEKLHLKLEELKDGFVSHEELAKVVLAGKEIHDDHEDRLRALEETKNKGLGALATWQQLLILLAAIGAIIGGLWWTVH